VGWWRRRSLRARLMLIAVCGLVVGLALGSAVLVVALQYGLQRSVDSEVSATADNVAQMVAEDTLPPVVPVAGAQEVQVLDAGGHVLYASAQADRMAPMLHPDELAEARQGKRFYVPGTRLAQAGQFRVIAVTATAPGNDGGERTILVAKSVADVRQSLHVLRVVLWVAFPPLVLGLALLAWRMLGAALGPVEALRRGAEEITGSARAGELPTPASRDEIHRLAVTLNDMLGRLEAARARQREFVADAAHELRSPLTNMRTQLEVAQRLGDRTDWTEVADDLLADTERLSRLVDDLLLLARQDETGTVRRPVEPVELGELVCQVARRYPSSPLTVVRPEEPLWTVGEPDALHRAVANLVDNATRHARTRVVLSADHDGADQRITVTDDGPGIPAADRERVFDRFTRLDDARARDAGGAGLGLAIVRELVWRHGGSVRLADARPSGLRAEIRLPAADDLA
jgi:signal transduction histidine kinase